MIISASRRTDIPAFFSDWLINRLKAGFVLIQNPRNPKRIANVALDPSVVDCIVFWTKNPQPMLNKLKVIDDLGYQYYFQFTITPYDQQVEKNLPAKREILETFKKLSHKIGKHRIIWRYDPVFINKQFPLEYHLDAFGRLCASLADYTNTCIFSFIDMYARVRINAKAIIATEVSEADKKRIAQSFSAIAGHHNLRLMTCSETLDFTSYGIARAACIDPSLLANMLGASVQSKKDPNQRPACKCIESIDLGAYDCCRHGCVYCYATTSEKTVSRNSPRHDPCSPLLIGHPQGDETITVREVRSLIDRQSALF
ncbi:DUF1848 domain-containing protein [Sporomusa aerivorans]|uniref:DUF1848 domain-containing protein n=1 Tax=Sporomusa aerivorans TaxID=204936 RepID=UPI00352B687A